MSNATMPALPRTGGALSVRGLTKSYGGVKALNGVDFEVAPGEILGLIGPNGSGKTTTIDCLCGLQRADAGSVRLDDNDITGWRTTRLAHAGMVRTFQSVRTFETLTVRRNLHLADLGRRTPRSRLRDLLKIENGAGPLDDRIDALIERFDLRRVADLPAGELSYGQRKLVEFAAACVRPPQVLLLDEPVAAVNPTVGASIRDWIEETAKSGTTVVLVEHNIEMVVDVCDRIVVLDQGRKIADGGPRQVIDLPEVQEAYFGRA